MFLTTRKLLQGLHWTFAIFSKHCPHRFLLVLIDKKALTQSEILRIKDVSGNAIEVADFYIPTLAF